LSFLSEKYREIIWATYVAVVTKKNQPPSLDVIAIKLFASTSDLEVASKLLEKPFDLRSFQILLNIFRKDKANSKLVFEKLMIIRNKEFGSTHLKVEMKLLKRNIRKLFVKYQDEYKYDQWKELWFKQRKEGKKKNQPKNQDEKKKDQKKDLAKP